MTILGQLQTGVVRIVKPGTGTEIGFAFTVEDGKGGQLQRWMLYEDPRNELEIRPPSQSMASWSLSDWQTHVNGALRTKWNEGSIYVWAQSNVYLPGNTYNGVKWGDKIPPAASLPKPVFPPEGAAHMQLDFRTLVTKIYQDTLRGLAFTVGRLSDLSSVEYWALSPSYQPAGKPNAVAATSTRAGTTATSLDDFIAVANKSWTANSRFVITGCVNYRNANGPPAVP
ncbi:hypothetical protein [Sorangium sp. So ce1182]|uniref:hypothetical protein n=1 Tax=Sorangium sp. So ce1182 TaxID=3133334 RepID=UPI003F5E67C2